MSNREHQHTEALEAVTTADVVALECRILEIGLGAARKCGLMDQYEEALAEMATRPTSTFPKVA